MHVENFYKFIKYYGKGRKIKLLGFFVLSTFASFLEFLGLALIYPFILLIIEPERVIHTKYYIDFASHFHLTNILTTAFILGLIVAFLFVVKNIFMVGVLYLQNKFVNNWKFAITKKFIHYYLFSPYKNSLKTSPSEKIYNLNFLINQTIDGFVFRIINLFTNSVIVVMILALLFIKFPLAAGVTTGFVLISLVLQHKFFKEKLKEVARQYSKASISNNEKTMECINNLKDIKISSSEDYFYNDYLATQKDYKDVIIKNNFYGAIPPYIIEVLIVISLFILAGMISIQNVENEFGMVASYAIIAAAIFRIAPALNRIQIALNAINASRDFVKTIIGEYEKNDFDFVEPKSNFVIDFHESIKLENVCFSYKKESVIKDLSLEIKKGEFVGIIGLSGAGKSTLADILMGLLPVSSGEILVDGVCFSPDKFSSFRKLIGYVPQQINIIDGSFKRNIAWSVEEKDINEAKVVEVLKQAQMYDIVGGLDGGIESKVIVGSMGLSQGQKQRLAIARALYRNPEVLIFDEATSSLDMETEYEITQMLNSMKGEKTIIAIAHRLSTLKSCDRLIYLKNGMLVDTGSFEELSQKYPDFEKLIRLSSLGININ